MMPLARAEAQKALDLSPSEPRAHAVLGWVAAFFDYNGGAGQEHFRMAMAADPVPSEVRGRYCLYLMFLGRVYQAIEEMESVLEQDPLNILWRCALSSFLNRAEMYDRAIAEARKALELQEDHSLPHSMLAQCHASQGMFAVAQEFAEKAHRLAPWNSGAAGLLAAIYTRTGNEDRAKAMLARPVPGATFGIRRSRRLVQESHSTARDPWNIHGFRRSPQAAAPKPRWPDLAKMMNLPERLESLVCRLPSPRTRLP
jgi:tetratricopeptide (TPR) repeat protein